MPYRIIFEEPPASRTGQRPENELTEYLTNLDQNHRGKWARLAKSRKHISYLYNLRKSKFPNMEIVTRRNADRTYGVWVRMTDAPVPTRSRGGRKPKAKAS